VAEASRGGELAGQFTIVIDDVSLLEVAAHGSIDNVLDFLHYSVTLTSEMVKDGSMKNCQPLLIVMLCSSRFTYLCPGRIARW
jgi:hypothetical protein